MMVTSGGKHPDNEAGMVVWNRSELATARAPAFVLDVDSKVIITLFKITK